MRVVLVCPYAWDRVGGVQTHVRALARGLRARAHHVTVIAPRAGSKAAPEEGVVVAGRAVAVPANGSRAPVSFGPAAGARVRRLLAGAAPDVVHLHEPLIPSLSLLALWSTDAPTVGTFHASADSSLGYSLARPLLRRAGRRLTVRTAVSDAARALIARYYPGDYTLTPNGIDTERFRTADAMDLGPGKKVLFLSRLERRKGLEILIQAMARIHDVGARLVVAGAGPEERRCRALAANLGVDASFLGPLGEGDLPRAYRAADAYCAPGLGGESFGVVLIEAMAAGTPVVCSDLPGFRAVAGGAAILVPPGDAGRLSDALRTVLTDEERAADMGRTSEKLSRMYDWGRLLSGVEAVYEKAVKGG